MRSLDIPGPHLRLILDAIPDGIGVECEGVIVYANEGFARIYGYASAEEILGRPLSRFVLEEDAMRMLDYGQKRKRGEHAPAHYAFKGLHKEGRVIDLEIHVSSYQSAGKTYVLGALRDVTERLALAERAEQRQKLEALGTLTRGIAHEFNNMLTAVIGNISLARQLIDNGASPLRSLERAQRAADKAAALTRQLQTFSSAKAEDESTSNPSRLIRDTVELLEHSAPPNIEVRLDLDPELPPAALPQDQLQQILMNLALNALDEMPLGGLLCFQARAVEVDEEEAFPGSRAGRYLRLRVDDTGGGIDPAVMPRIFEPFFTTKAVDKGTGLGLAVAYGIARSCQGWLGVQSEPGKGACFTVWLPAAQVAWEEKRVVKAEREVRAETILVVDDEAQIRDLFREILELRGYRVVIAEGGAQAQEPVERALREGNPVDLAVVDLVMPGVDGATCVRRLLAIQPSLQILLCTGLEADERVAPLRADPRIALLCKPVSSEALLEAIGQRLEARSSQRSFSPTAP